MAEDPIETNWQEEAEKWKAHAQKWEDRAKADHAKVSEFEQRISEMESAAKDVGDWKAKAEAAIAELDGLKAQNARAEAVSKVATEYGIDASVLRGDTEDELRAHAEQLKPLLAAARGVRGGTEGHETPPQGAMDSFAKFMEQFNS